jgi:hypothetical protein
MPIFGNVEILLSSLCLTNIDGKLILIRINNNTDKYLLTFTKKYVIPETINQIKTKLNQINKGSTRFYIWQRCSTFWFLHTPKQEITVSVKFDILCTPGGASNSFFPWGTHTPFRELV